MIHFEGCVKSRHNYFYGQWLKAIIGCYKNSHQKNYLMKILCPFHLFPLFKFPCQISSLLLHVAVRMEYWKLTLWCMHMMTFDYFSILFSGSTCRPLTSDLCTPPNVSDKVDLIPTTFNKTYPTNDFFSYHDQSASFKYDYS